jgi:outer membrane lipoprotein-sorting protein
MGIQGVEGSSPAFGGIEPLNPAPRDAGLNPFFASVNRMVRAASILLIPVFILLSAAISAPLSDHSEENRVLAIVQKMESAFKSVEDYSCEVEQIFYKDGIEDQRYRFKVYFKRKKKIRVDFSSPYHGLSLFYNDEEKQVTAMPFRFLSLLKFHFAIDDPTIQTPAGQRINQTDMGYFIEFLFNNLKKIEQKDVEYKEDRDRIVFSLLAADYIGGKFLEKYRIVITNENWLPIRIERYNLEGKPIEVSMIQNYVINTHLEDRFFRP